MAKSKALIAAEARIAELEAALAGAQARLQVAREVFRNQRTHIAELEAALNTRGGKPCVAAKPVRVITPVVTHYTDRFGRVWEQTRVGNRASSRLVLPNQEHAHD